MNIDEAKLDDVVLALLHLNTFDDRGEVRAWKSLSWDALDRLAERGLISDPRSKAKSVVLSDEGAALARDLFERFFASSGSRLEHS
jgi:hypothetical protein